MFSQKLFLLLIFGLLAAAFESELQESEEGMHKCPSCATGGFVLKRWLMQHPEASQSMGWVDWKGTNCDAGTVYIVPCRHSCLTVIVEKQLSLNEYLYQGTMQECSDGLIRQSSDLPSNIDFKSYNKDSIFISKRMGHRITYKFERESFIDIHEANVRKSQQDKVSKKDETPVQDLFVMFGIILSFLIIVSVFSVTCKVCFYKHQMRQMISSRNENLEMKHDVESNSSEQLSEQVTVETFVEHEDACRSELSIESDEEAEDEETNNNGPTSV
uniref:CUB domain-containing protein n=1 Tax=Caenorhabditis tropicalis TaxID=1561998 RepID=A0A1I7U0I3_9PELO